jgi:iron complex outermembrane receptor protein
MAASYNYYRLNFEELLSREEALPFDKAINQFSPRIAVVKPIGDQIVIHGNISHGFSPPQSDTYYNTDGSVNNKIGATNGFNKEIGIRGNWLNKKLSVDLVAYRLNLQDVIVPKVYANVGGVDLISNENAGAIDQQGIELATHYIFINKPKEIISFAKLWSSYTFNDYVFKEYNTITATDGIATENDFSGKVVPGTHPHILVAGLDLVSRPGFYMNNTFSYFDASYLDNANTVKDDAYQLLDMKAGYRKLVGKKLELNIFGGINNLLDTSYSSQRTFNAFLGSYYDPSPGRNYYTGFRLRYVL